MTPFADLHCHTTCSDGSCSPEEILNLAHAKGFKGVALTDHDTVEGYQALAPKAQAQGIELLSGIEFSCSHKGASVHILGYNFKIDAPPLLQLIQRHKTRRRERNLAILANLEKHRIPLSEQEVVQQGSMVIGRPHIALAMVQKGYVSTVQEAFRKYLGEGKLCYAPGVLVSVEETIDILHAAGGKAVIAHPHLIDSPSLFQDLLQMPFDGIECYYALFKEDRNSRFIDLARRKGWIETGGSDFHGAIKPSIPYGASFVDETRFRMLQT